MFTKLEAFSFLKEHQPMPSDVVDYRLGEGNYEYAEERVFIK